MSSNSVLGGESKRLHGQFFTITNPFNVDPFHKWLKAIPCVNELVFLEPFAGANNIVTMIQDLGYLNTWSCFDIDPAPIEQNATDFMVVTQDTLKHYPNGYEVAITNPPYLAKNSATRRGLPFHGDKYDDLYKVALDVMLKGTPYVAAIIPESFITQKLFHDRLAVVISLTCKMFEDTEVPVCLALFVPTEVKADTEDFMVFSENRLLGSYKELRCCLEIFSGTGLPWRFNDPQGLIGLHAVDGQKEASIRFVTGDSIPSSEIKESSRSLTRISAEISSFTAEKIIVEANRLLLLRRERTKDAFMTAFKGLRKDGRYRRRLDFAQARDLLNLAARNVGAL